MQTERMSMPQLQYKHIRLLTAMYVSIIVSTSINTQNAWLALFGVLSGMIFLWAVKRKMQVQTSDEMIENIAGKAARTAYGMITVILASLSLLLNITGEPTGYLTALATILSYLTLSLIALYSLAYYYYQKQLT